MRRNGHLGNTSYSTGQGLSWPTVDKRGLDTKPRRSCAVSVDDTGRDHDEEPSRGRLVGEKQQRQLQLDSASLDGAAGLAASNIQRGPEDTQNQGLRCLQRYHYSGKEPPCVSRIGEHEDLTPIDRVNDAPTANALDGSMTTAFATSSVCSRLRSAPCAT